MLTGFKRFILLTSFLVVIFPDISQQRTVYAAVPIQDESAFATRMMTLDKNKDGFLTSDELPKSVLSQIASADLNKDGKWTSAELSTLAQAAKDSRMKDAPQLLDERPKGRGRGRAGRMGIGRGPMRPNTGPGSPLDKAQILKFALTFDADKDGGLNSEELDRYATALAGRRARARKQREAENSTTPDAKPSPALMPGAEERDGAKVNEEASGLKSKADARNSNPFGNGSGK